MQSRILGLAVLAVVSPALADNFTWTVDSTTSVLTTKISATIGSTISDSETNHVAGNLGGTLALPSYTFGSIHLTAADLSYTTNPTFSLTQPFVGGVNIVGNGLGFAIPGPNNLGFPSPTPVSVDLAGNFSQVGNGAEGRGTLTYTGVGILGASIGTGSINLLDQSPLSMDWNGTIIQTGNQLLITLPITVDQTTVQNNIPVRVEISGNVYAKATTTANGWKADVDGTWNSQANWIGSTAIPGAAGQSTFDTAVFGDFGANSHRAVTVSSALTPRRVLISPGATGQYRFTGTQPISLTANANGAASIAVLTGEGRFDAPIVLVTDATLHAEAASSLVTVSVASAESTMLNKTGAGALHVTAADVGTIHIAGGTVAFDGASAARVKSLQIDAAGSASVHESLVVESQAGGVQAITDYLETSFAAGATGGILPIAAGRLGVGTKASTGLSSFDGLVLSNSSILIRSTLAGDANLDRAVNFDDLLLLAQHYGGAGYWFDGDFNYDGSVNFDDLLDLAQRYGTALSREERAQMSAEVAFDFARARSLVPEPTLCVALTGLSLVQRRRRMCQTGK